MRVVALTLCVALGGCSTSSLTKFNTFQTNFQTVVTGINTDIAAVAPIVAADCADLQKWAMLIIPFIPNNGKAQQYVGAANGALNAYCQNIPTDINGTATAVLKAVQAAQSGYDSISGGK